MVGRGIRFRRRTAEWITHTFREHNTEADLRANKGAKGRVEEWVDTTRIEWQEVSGTGAMTTAKCGCGIILMASSEPHDGLLSTKSVVLFRG